jgi:hypothetical protein
MNWEENKVKNMECTNWKLPPETLGSLFCPEDGCRRFV